MQYQVIICENCGNEFVWSEDEQDLYKARGLDRPSLCPICRGMLEAEKKASEGNK